MKPEKKQPLIDFQEFGRMYSEEFYLWSIFNYRNTNGKYYLLLTIDESLSTNESTTWVKQSLFDWMDRLDELNFRNNYPRKNMIVFDHKSVCLKVNEIKREEFHELVSDEEYDYNVYTNIS